MAKKKVAKKKVAKKTDATTDPKPQSDAKAKTPAAVGKPVELDPALVERAKKVGFTDKMLRAYTSDEQLRIAVNRIKPGTDQSDAKAMTAKKRVPVLKAGEIPKDAKTETIKLQSVTPREKYNMRNRFTFDQGQAQLAIQQRTKELRAAGKAVFVDTITTVQHNQPDIKGGYITDIEIVLKVK